MLQTRALTRLVSLFLVLAASIQASSFADHWTLGYIGLRIVFPGLALVLSVVLVLSRSNGRSLPRYSLIMLIGVGLASVLAAVMSHLVYGQSFIEGLVTQGRLLPLLFFPPVLWLLDRTKVSYIDCRRSLLALFIISVVVALLYNSHLGSGVSELLPDLGWRRYGIFREARAVTPSIFIILGSFAGFRAFVAYRSVLGLVSYIAGLAILGIVIQQRLFALGVLVVTFLRISRHLSVRGLTVLMTVMVASLVTILFRGVPDAWSFDGILAGLLHRVQTIDAIVQIFSDAPLLLILGVGRLRGSGELSFQTLYGDWFFPTDVGWLGLVFQYGLWGVVGALVYYAYFLRTASKASRSEGRPWLLAIYDYALMTVLLSPFIPFVPVYGSSLATLFAIAVYFARQNYTKVYAATWGDSRERRT